MEELRVELEAQEGTPDSEAFAMRKSPSSIGREIRQIERGAEDRKEFNSFGHARELVDYLKSWR